MIPSIIYVSLLATLAFASPLDKPKSPPKCMYAPNLTNDCKVKYATVAYDFCKEPQKTFDIADCKDQKGKKQICEYHLNKCDKRVGGCYPADGPIPLWADPGCP